MRTVLLVAACLALAADDEKRLAGLKEKARALVEALAKEDFAAAGKDFDDAMQKALPEDKRKEMWQGMTKALGAFRSQANVRTEKAAKYDVVLITCRFEKVALDARVVFDARDKVAGLNFRTAGSDYKAPAYVGKDSFTEREVTVGSGEWALPGTLAVPKGDGPFPAVVLVHGSGSHDRDETIGPNRPFKDLAWGLASRGVAVLRYEKRTLAHAAKFKEIKDVTLKEEVLDDALAAAALLRKTDKIDPKKVFVLGHSLGGILLPKLGADDPELAGLISLAGATRPLEDLVLEQMEYLWSLDGDLSEDDKKKLEELKQQVARVKGPKLTGDVPAKELPLGMPAVYWLSLAANRPLDWLPKAKQPFLVLQGERDYQVTMADFALWKKALEGRPGAALKSYPKLNHLFMEGEAKKAKPEEYAREGHVHEEVVNDIADWVKKQ